FDFHQNQDIKDYPDNYFLYEHQLSDAVLAPALDKLARFEKLPIDYSFLGVRQLGSIYEGLLEYRVVVEDENRGKVHLENDKGERKSTGSYYTPDYIVKYIVSHTLKPILAERKQQFADLMMQINQVQENLKDGRLGVQSRNGLQKDLQRLERTAQNTLLDIKICDPAMGSGHFLVEAVDFLTDELISILNEYPEYNPVLEMLEVTRNSILANLQNQGITIDVSKLEDTQLLQRVVMKRCIYGVDLNPMAVELAKVSLWLHSFTIGAPLSFLDHHLRCGNSLIGTTAKEAEAKMQQEESGQLSLLTGPFVGLLRAAEIMRGVSTLSDATFAEVETSERLFKEFDKAVKPYKRLLDVYVSQFFGVKQAKNWLERWGTNAISVNSENLKDDDLLVYEDATRLFEEKRFFHWDLEFPEVFIDLENASWKDNSGFDAVIGNPPYDELSNDRNDEINYFKSIPKFKPSLGNRINIYRIFIVQAIFIIQTKGRHGFIVPLSLLADEFTLNLRKYILENVQIDLIEQFPQKDDPHNRIFFDAKLSTCLYVICKQKPLKEHLVYVRTHTGKLICEHSHSYKTLQFSFLRFDTINLSIPGLNENSWNLVLKLATNENFSKLEEFVNASPGELMINSSFKPYLSNKELGEEAIRGSHIARYAIVEPKQGENVFFNRSLYLEEHSQSKKAFAYQSKRVIYQRYAAIDNYRRLIATILPENYFCSHTTGYFSDVKVYNLEFLTALLNSKLLDWRFNLTSTNNNINGYEIKSLPVPQISFTTPPENRQEYLQNLINLYQQYQNNQNADILLTHIILHLSSSQELVIVCLYPLLIQIGLHQLGSLLLQNFHHIHQQPSQADVIHDFLAYLAEQMIELNQQKQTETKGFIKWL
ncbi:MAG: Eco57I restriction-modification methylase domain-containing protein, partial [Dolichospermum sp.]